MVAYRVIGKPIGRPDGVDKVTGRGKYAGDYALPGTLWGKALHSPYPHARILRIDTAAAKALPGVYAVLTAADIPEAGLYGRAIEDVPVLAVDRVRFVGERVAAVAAEDEDIAQAALDLIEVEYEELPAVFDPVEALAAGAPVLHPDFATYKGGKELETPTNAYSSTVFERGDVEAGFAAADLVVENTYFANRVHQAYLEPQSVLVDIDEDAVQVWTCSKSPYDTREAIAASAVVPPDAVVFNHTYIGGDFGGKATPANLPIAYYLAKATGRPVRMVLEYVEEFMSANPRHSVTITLRTGVRKDGSITAHASDIYCNTGAFAGYKPLGIIGGAIRAGSAGPYRMDACRLASAEIYTNTVPCGHMRSPGEPQAVFALESHIDEVARALGMDPLEFRLRNVIVDGDSTPMGVQHHELRGVETLRAAAEASGYYTSKARNVGRGVAMCDRAPVGGEGTLKVTLNDDGSVVLGTPIFDQGTGTYATLAQVVAEELQLPPERIRLEYWNTSVAGYDSGIGGMRATRVNTLVAYEAAQDTKQALFTLAADELGWPLDKLVLRGDELIRTDHEETVRWAELLSQAGRSVSGQGHVREQGRTEVTCFAVQVAEVAVDPETGEVELLGMTTVHDVGQVINPIGHQGQINGGLVQGIGYGLMEELRVEDGRVTTLSFGDYKIPTAADIPPLKTVLLPSESGVGPYHIKGIGETPNTPTAAAIANAVADAIGVRIRDLPVTSEKVYAALKKGARP